MDIINKIGLITVFLFVFLSLFLFTTPSKNKRPNALFACFLLITSFDISALFLTDLFTKYPSFNIFRVSSVFLQMPLFYFYVKTMCFHNFKLTTKQLIQLIPFWVFCTIFYLQGLTSFNYLMYEIAAQIQYYAYIISVFYVLKHYKQLHLENYSLQNKTYRWLISISIVFLIGNSFVLFRTIFRTFFNYRDLMPLNIGISLFGLGVICWFMLKAMRNPDLFIGIDQHIKPLQKGKVEKKDEYQKEIDRLVQYMKTHKPYLDENLTLRTLAEKVEIPEKQLSFLINRVLGKHFFDFINTYRIQEAKVLLQHRELNIQQIMYQVGFNSKSSFNTAFKKYTSLTPSKYRKSII